MEKKITVITEKEIVDSKNISNCVFVDFGDTDGFAKEHRLVGGKTIYIASDLDYGGFDYIKRSGKVLKAVDDFVYHKPFNPKTNPTLMSERISVPFVENGDVVFYEPETKAWCEEKGLKFKTDAGAFVYAVPYRFLICAVKKPSDKVVMLNGKVMVSRNLDLAKETVESKIIHIEKKYHNDLNNWCDVTIVNNNEGYEGTWFRDDYLYWGRNGNDIEQGHQVLVKKYGSFNLQNCLREEQDVDELTDVYSVERKKIIAVREDENAEPRPYGFFVKIKVDDNYEANADLYKMSESGIWLKKRGVPSFKGKVVEIGCAVDEVVVGDEVFFKHKKDSIEVINNHAYVRQEWIERIV